MKKALITGVNGQDGSYLSEYLLSLGYEVHGLVRRHSVAEDQDSRINKEDIKTYYSDMTDETSLANLINKIQPDEIYNLAAMSHVRISFEIPSFTIKTNALGVLNILETTRTNCPNAKIYQASSSEMFGNSVDSDGYQRLTTPMMPVSPYGCSKLLAYHLVKHYRTAYKKFYCNGILFNHESPRRGSNFVTNKIVKTAVEIKLGIKKKLELGNLNSSRDWGHSKDYVKAMHLIMQHKEARDWTVATGETRSVRQLCELTFKMLGLNYEDFVVQNNIYLRPDELKYLKGDSTEVREILKWKPEYTFESLINEMVEFWQNKLK
jgi:GDPmannose 4,6-dehydratase